MRIRILGFAAFLALQFATACATGKPERKQPASIQGNPYSTFSSAVSAIADGDVEALLALRNEPRNTQMAEFLRTLYSRYGKVERLHSIGFEREGTVARGVFLAQHERGPFLWDMIADGETYTMLRGSNDFAAYLHPVPPDPDAMSLAMTSMDRLNAGDSIPVFDNLICNCITPAQFERQVQDVKNRAGAELAREFIRAESIPGLEDQLQLLHFLSQREGLYLGYHFTMWKVGGQWRINAVNWTQEELLPQPLKNVSQR